MAEIANRSNILEDTPPISAPFVEILQNNKQTPFSEQLLLGAAQDITSIDIHTRKLLRKLKTINNRLNPRASPIYTIYYMEEVKRLREATSSRPSDTTPAMVNTEDLFL